MIKIRIWASEEEINKVVNSLKENNKDLEIVKESENYKDRKPSELFRKYIEVNVSK